MRKLTDYAFLIRFLLMIVLGGVFFTISQRSVRTQPSVVANINVALTCVSTSQPQKKSVWTQISVMETQPSVRDTVETRSFSKEKINRFKNDPDFDYGERTAPVISLWDRIRFWIAEQLAKLFGNAQFSGVYKFMLYGLCFLVIIFAVLKLLGVNVTQLFYGRSDQGLVLDHDLEHQMHTTDFEKEIAQALEEQAYRRAVRLRYIYTLKKLSDRQLIRWQPGKTNRDYLAEMEDEVLKNQFSKLSYYYEYVWYGNFPASEAMYRQVDALSQQISLKVTA